MESNTTDMEVFFKITSISRVFIRTYIQVDMYTFCKNHGIWLRDPNPNISAET